MLFKRGEIKILQRDAHMVCPTTEEDAFEKGENKHRALARPPVEVAGATHPRSTYRGARQPEGQSKKRAAFGAYTGGVPVVPVFELRPKEQEPLVLKPGPGVFTKRKPQPKPPQAGPVEPFNPLQVPEAHEHKVPEALEPETVKTEQANKGEDPEWKEVPPRGRRPNRPRAPRPPKPPTPKNPKAKAPSRKRWASWSSSGSDPEIVKQLNLTLKKEGDAGLVISSEDPLRPGFESVGSMAVLSKARKKLVTKGISRLSDHDKALKHLLDVGGIGTTIGPKHIVMFTSDPKHFQDPMFHCVNVGSNATGDWTPNGARKELQGIGPRIVVILGRP